MHRLNRWLPTVVACAIALGCTDATQAPAAGPLSAAQQGGGALTCDFSALRVTATQTETPMFSVQMFINIPAAIHISALREEFMEFCHHLNVDAIMEPVKHS
jgi:glycine cleavage system transcriptional repressor